MDDTEKPSESKQPKRKKGRPKGALNRVTRLRLAALATAGMSPREWLTHVVGSPLYSASLRTKAAISLTKGDRQDAEAEPESTRDARVPTSRKMEESPPPPLPMTDAERARLKELQRYHRWQLVGLEPYDMVKERELDDLARRAGETHEGVESREDFLERRRLMRIKNGHEKE